MFSYFYALNVFENELKDFGSKGFGNDILKDKKWVENMNEVASQLSSVTASFVDFLDKLMVQREKGIADSEYVKIFSLEEFKRIIDLIYPETSHHAK